MRKSIAAAALVLTACATTSGSPKAHDVQFLSEAPSECRLISNVAGDYHAPQGSTFYTTDERALKDLAQDDLLEEAANKGATHVVLLQATVGGVGASANAQATGVAYKCPPGWMAASK